MVDRKLDPESRPSPPHSGSVEGETPHSPSFFRSGLAGYLMGVESKVGGRGFIAIVDFMFGEFWTMTNVRPKGLKAWAFVFTTLLGWLHCATIRWALPYQASTIVLMPRAKAEEAKQQQVH